MCLYQNLFALLVVGLSWGFVTFALPTGEIVIQQQVYVLKDILVELHKRHEFDNFIIYRTPSKFYEPPLENMLTLRNIDQGKYLSDEIIYKNVDNILVEHVMSLQPQRPIMTYTISPWDYVNDTKAIPNLANILTNKNLAVVIINDIFNCELKEFVSISLGASFETRIIFFLIGHEMTNVYTYVRSEKLRRFFLWCWEKNILNVLLLFQKQHIVTSLDELILEVCTYTPFTRLTRIIQLQNEHPSRYFEDTTLNLSGYQLSAPVIADKPHVFKSSDPFTGHEIVTGISGKIFMEYVKYVKGTFEELKSSEINTSWTAAMDYIYDLLKSRRIDISIHAVTALVPTKFSISYPISNTNNCVVVPIKQEIYPGLYIPKTLSVQMWLLLLVLFVTFLMVYMLINYDNYGLLKPWLAFSTTLKGMLNMPLDNMSHCKSISLNSPAYKRKICLHMLLLLAGMVYCQTHIAALSSFLSSTLYPEQIESLEDLIAANLSIMIVDYIYETYKYLDLIPESFRQHLVIATADKVSYHLNQLDTRYAYTVYNDEWKVIQYLQMHLSKPLFRIVPKLCIPNVHLSLPMQFNSPFQKSFKDFIMISQSTGLDIKWSDMIYWQIHKANGLSASMMYNLGKTTNHFGLEHLTYILYIYVGGMLSAILVFLIELKLPHLNKKKFEKSNPKESVKI